MKNPKSGDRVSVYGYAARNLEETFAAIGQRGVVAAVHPDGEWLKVVFDRDATGEEFEVHTIQCIRLKNVDKSQAW